jgi:hypothetical protein
MVVPLEITTMYRLVRHAKLFSVAMLIKAWLVFFSFHFTFIENLLTGQDAMFNRSKPMLIIIRNTTTKMSKMSIQSVSCGGDEERIYAQ